MVNSKSSSFFDLSLNFSCLPLGFTVFQFSQDVIFKKCNQPVFYEPENQSELFFQFCKNQLVFESMDTSSCKIKLIVFSLKKHIFNNSPK
jgi:hypothetical protein